MNPQPSNRAVLVVAALSALGIIAGAFGTWVQVYETEKEIADGLERDGLATLCLGVCAALGACLAFALPRAQVAAAPVLAACGAAAVALGLDNMAEVRNENGLGGIKPVIDIEPGWGLLLTTAAGGVLCVAAIALAARLARAPR